MKGFILILTLFSNKGEIPQSVTAVKVGDYKSCKKAGDDWLKKLNKKKGFFSGVSNESFYICSEYSVQD